MLEVESQKTHSDNKCTHMSGWQTKQKCARADAPVLQEHSRGQALAIPAGVRESGRLKQTLDLEALISEELKCGVVGSRGRTATPYSSQE